MNVMRHKTFNKSQLLVLFGGLLFVYWPQILIEVFPQVSIPTLPSVMNLFPGLFAWFILGKMKSPYSKLLAYIWLVWYCVGTLNTIASSLIFGSYYSNLDLNLATEIFLWACVLYFFGLLSFEYTFTTKTTFGFYGTPLLITKFNSITGLILTIFPFLWISSMYLSVGYIPILSGSNIVDEMYEIYYGPLYAYGSCLVISIIYTGYMAMTSLNFKRASIHAIITIVFLFISMADGKRGFAMVSIASLLGISLRVLKEKTWTRMLPILIYMMIAMYVTILLIRTSGESGAVTHGGEDAKFLLVGVEFRDFVYTVNFFQPGEIKNYSWAISSLSSMMNGFLMSILGFDKSELIELDSAHAWAAIWNSKLGIRTGIVSELWFAYGVFSMFILYLFGFLSGFIINKLRTLKNIRDTIFFAAIYGLLFLEVTSQSTFTFGVLPVFLYLYISIRTVEFLFGTKVVVRARRYSK